MFIVSEWVSIGVFFISIEYIPDTNPAFFMKTLHFPKNAFFH